MRITIICELANLRELYLFCFDSVAKKTGIVHVS